MTEYIKTPTIRIYSPSMWMSHIYVSKEKALAKLAELMTGNKEKEFHIEYDPNGQIIKGFNEDTQKVEE